jgi:GTP 3',8-cyclase
MHNGKIHTKRLEINVVHHCNMSCKGCSHLSPLMPEFFISPDTLFQDLSILSRYCRPARISLLGGEPLLHPDLVEIINIVRRTGITDKIRVVTNGLLLHKMPERFWQAVDEVHVSLYPSHPMKIKDLAVFKVHAKRNATTLGLRYQDYFSEFFLNTVNTDNSLVKKIYMTCNAPREACCHTLYEGRYYKCPKAVYIPMVYKEPPNLIMAKDGIDIRRNGHLADELAEYITAKTPLAACRYCLGSVGRRFTPQQISRKDISQHASNDQLIDWKRLEKLEKKRGMPVPDWLQEALYQATSLMMAKLPPAMLLSQAIRRSITALSGIKRKYMK